MISLTKQKNGMIRFAWKLVELWKITFLHEEHIIKFEIWWIGLRMLLDWCLDMKNKEKRWIIYWNLHCFGMGIINFFRYDVYGVLEQTQNYQVNSLFK